MYAYPVHTLAEVQGRGDDVCMHTLALAEVQGRGDDVCMHTQFIL